MRLFIHLSVEAQAVAADMKRRGHTVNVGDPLPMNLPTVVAQEIQDHLTLFRLAWHMAPSQGDT